MKNKNLMIPIACCALLCCKTASYAQEKTQLSIAAGKFAPTDESLQQYQ